MDPFSILDTDAADNTEPSTPRPMQASHHDEQAPRSSPASTLEFHDVRGDPPTPKEQKTAAPEPSSPTVGGMPPLPVRVRSTPAVRGNESLDELLAPTADASSPTGASPPPPPPSGADDGALSATARPVPRPPPGITLPVPVPPPAPADDAAPQSDLASTLFEHLDRFQQALDARLNSFDDRVLLLQKLVGEVAAMPIADQYDRIGFCWIETW